MSNDGRVDFPLGKSLKSDKVKSMAYCNMIEHADGLEHGLRYMHPCRTNFA